MANLLLLEWRIYFALGGGGGLGKEQCRKTAFDVIDTGSRNMKAT